MFCEISKYIGQEFEDTCGEKLFQKISLKDTDKSSGMPPQVKFSHILITHEEMDFRLLLRGV